jgi:hypothetical protein
VGASPACAAGQQAAYLAGLHAASEAVAAGGSPTALADRVGQLLTDILGLQKCHFILAPAAAIRGCSTTAH